MRLGGWQRIGIVASVIWFFAGGFVGNKLAIDEASAKTSFWFESCVAGNKIEDLGRMARIRKFGHRVGISMPRSM